MVVDRIVAGLHNEDISAAHIFQNLKIDFAIAETAEHGFAQRNVEMLADGFCQHRVRSTRKNFKALVVHEAILSFLSLLTHRSRKVEGSRVEQTRNTPNVDVFDLELLTFKLLWPTLRINREAHHEERCDCASDEDTNRETRSRRRKSDPA